MSATRLGFLSVVFEPEVPLQILQARSFDRHLDPDVADTFVVVDNTAAGLSRSSSERLRRSYGKFADQVRIVRMKDLAKMPGRHGWVRQQVAKLLAGRLFEGEHYVALDAKNHLIRRVGAEDFVTETGYARSGRHPYHEHPLRDRLRSTLDYLGATPEQIERSLDLFPTTTTPFVLSRPLVGEILGTFDDAQAFASDFQRAGLLEFFFYSGWLEIRGAGFDSLYRDVPIQCPTVWPKASDDAGVAAATARASEIDAPFFAVHRRSLLHADHAAADALAAFWRSRDLFATEREALDFIADFQRGFQRRMLIARGAEKASALLAPLRLRKGGAPTPLSVDGDPPSGATA